MKATTTSNLSPISFISYAMFFWRHPFKRWSLLQHMLMGSLCVALFATTGYWYLQRLQKSLAALQEQHRTISGQLDSDKAHLLRTPLANFTQDLPKVSRAEEVAQDISKFAQSLGVQIALMTIENRPTTSNSLGSVLFALTLQAEYPASKAWLAELLGRYPTLAVQSMSFRGRPNDALRQEIQMNLVFYTKD